MKTDPLYHLHGRVRRRVIKARLADLRLLPVKCPRLIYKYWRRGKRVLSPRPGEYQMKIITNNFDHKGRLVFHIEIVT